MADIGDNSETVTIAKSHYDNLLHSQKFLHALASNGVYNWEGYSDALNEAFPDEDD